MRILFLKFPDFSGIKRRWNYLKICFLTLTYNSHSSASEVIFEPIITLVDFIARWFGFVFVTVATVLIGYVVVTYYALAIPYLKEAYSMPRAAVTIFYGHYLLVMISFHYFKAVRTSPGRPPKDASDRAVTSVCKKCILPKPPRAHHCSVCKNCVLKMDHHCPWINNCVGHFNHRHFISFCIFMWLGTFYVITTTWPLFYDCFDVPQKVQFTKDWISNAFSSTAEEVEADKDSVADDHSREHFSRDISKRDIFQSQFLSKLNGGRRPREYDEHHDTPNLCNDIGFGFRSHVIFLWLLCMGVTAALGALTAIQVRLVSWGETSIEKLINEKESKKAKKLGRKFQNPYDLGFAGNWKMLLCFQDLHSFFWNVLLPNVRLPIGDGLVWDGQVNANYNGELYINSH